MLSDYQLRLQGIAPMVSDIATVKADVAALKTQIQQPSAQSPVLPLVPKMGTATPMMRDTSSTLVTDPASLDVQPDQRFGNVQVDSIGFGGPPIRGCAAAIRKGGEIVYLEKVPSASTQEKSGDKIRSGVFSINAYDNGMRLIRGGFWVGGVLHRTQPVLDIFGFDSAGTVSKSSEDYSKPQVEKCQDWIVAMDWVAKKIKITACRAGWGVDICASSESTNYLNDPNDGRPNFNRSAEIIEPLDGAA
jgi:hypothetical protein